jgi:hypothetical protein
MWPARPRSSDDRLCIDFPAIGSALYSARAMSHTTSAPVRLPLTFSRCTWSLRGAGYNSTGKPQASLPAGLVAGKDEVDSGH